MVGMAKELCSMQSAVNAANNISSNSGILSTEESEKFIALVNKIQRFETDLNTLILDNPEEFKKSEGFESSIFKKLGGSYRDQSASFYLDLAMHLSKITDSI